MKRYRCPTCGGAASYDALTDRYFCRACDLWIEAICTCPSVTCEFAAAYTVVRDCKPSELSDPDVRARAQAAVKRLVILKFDTGTK